MLLLSGSGCDRFLGDPGADNRPGEPLGRYGVAAELNDNDCGAGALGASEVWSFEVELARDDEYLYWDNGQEVLHGDIADDDVTFVFETAVLQDMREPNAPTHVPPCSLLRTDQAEGTLSSPDMQVQSFGGTLRYTFVPTDGSECSDLVSSQTPIFAKLPCSMAYDIQGELLQDD